MSDREYHIGKWKTPGVASWTKTTDVTPFAKSLVITCYNLFCERFSRLGLDDRPATDLCKWYPLGRLSFKLEGAGKERIFAIPNAFKQALFRPAHDWCMSILRLIPMDGMFDQTRPLGRL